MGYTFNTKKGYELLEVSSAFQKSIRRGLEDEAFYWGVELYNSGYDEYAWKRMRVIVSEDIGLANPTLPAVIDALYRTYIDLKKKATEKMHPEKQPFTQAILTLVRSPKSRLGDWAVKYHWRVHDTIHMEIPEWALDSHTVKGRIKGKGIDDFYNEGTKLANHQEQPREAEYKKKAYELEKKEKPVEVADQMTLV